MTVTLTRQGAIASLTLGDDENRFSAEWFDEIESALDDLEATPPGALVSAGGGKFFSNGLVEAEITAEPERRSAYLARVHDLLARVTTLPCPTVASINGHAFGAGAMLALAHDFRVMNASRGYVCFPEVDIKIPFTTGMAALIQAKIPPAAAIEAMTTGRRYGGPDALERGIVDRVSEPDDLLDDVRGFAESLLGKDPATLKAIKDMMFAGPVEALRASPLS
ncbi:enoyl-CoA hydratase [Frondihabitans sp. PAMC 28766]|uniref:enoyl-CoA hydratase/isomerase family protein n=1 Tax=Frondihabitans sp. PAMC 28766 TaxID=1795630 RepID=UPI00078CBFEA|nr:enoyl-CoA hydratase/isomerase family protein [Frondihabitans sp. PAMC 28766]AMM22110.1 enoyl-CoA hydratase [Frondihabitans sp. PAMC 28766]